MAPFRSLSRRDAILILLGAGSMHALSSIFSFPQSSIIINTTHSSSSDSHPPFDPVLDSPFDFEANNSPPLKEIEVVPITTSGPVEFAETLPETKVLAHAPGWTVFQDVYMSNGTFFIVSSEPPSSFPDRRLVISTGLPGYNNPENIAAREPTDNDLMVIDPQEAMARWGGEKGDRHRVWDVEGNTFLFNDPDQFLGHYYHFCGELLFGSWAFWHGTFAPDRPFRSPGSKVTQDIPLPNRLVFSHTSAEGWRDRPGFNPYFLRAAFPGVSVEHVDDWEDRIAGTVPPDANIAAPHYADVHSDAPEREPVPFGIGGLRGTDLHAEANALARAWHFPRLLLVDRSAAHRGERCGRRTQRTASEAIGWLRDQGRISGRGWWEHVRRGVLGFAGVEIGEEGYGMTDAAGDWEDAVVVTYISRQGSRRRLLDEDHEALVDALEALVRKKNEDQYTARRWELNVVQAERMSKDEQVRVAGRTTVLVGVHGNGLSHLIMMPPSRLSAVVEIFYPGGFAHDYEWTAAGGLDMGYYAVWNDTFHAAPKTFEMTAAYVEGFHGTEIPVHAETVAGIVEEHIERAGSG